MPIIFITGFGDVETRRLVKRSRRGADRRPAFQILASESPASSGASQGWESSRSIGGKHSMNHRMFAAGLLSVALVALTAGCAETGALASIQ
jgi:hypothetical protein